MSPYFVWWLTDWEEPRGGLLGGPRPTALNAPRRDGCDIFLRASFNILSKSGPNTFCKGEMKYSGASWRITHCLSLLNFLNTGPGLPAWAEGMYCWYWVPASETGRNNRWTELRWTDGMERFPASDAENGEVVSVVWSRAMYASFYDLTGV